MAERKQRNSAIELMKIIALFFVVLCHSLPLYKLGGTTELTGYLNLREGATNIQQIILIIYSHLGQIGNALFLVPSAYFLLDSNDVNKNKIVQFIADTFIVSVVFLALFIIIKGNIPISFIITSLFPTTFGFYWFITCYILLYSIHPWLNTVINKLEKKQLFITCVTFFILYCGISFVLDGKYYYSQLIGFIVYYFFVSYVKLYLKNLSTNKSVNRKILLFSICGFICLIIVSSYIGVRFNVVNGLVGHFETFINPFIVGIAISLFDLCNTHNWYNKIVNGISATSLLVFVISNNQLACSFLKPNLFEYIFSNYSYSYITIICPVIAFVTLLISILISLVYSATIQKIVRKVCGKIVSICSGMTSKLFEYIDRLEIKGDR